MRIFAETNIVILLIISCSSKQENTYLIKYVNPIFGTAPSSTFSSIKHGNDSENNAQVIPEVTAPFSMTN